MTGVPRDRGRRASRRRSGCRTSERTTLKEHFLHPFDRTTYEQQEALDDVSFTRRARASSSGSSAPNGSGKSTLLKILAGIYRQDAGTVASTACCRRSSSSASASTPSSTPATTSASTARCSGCSKRELDERFDEIVAFAELERFVDQKLKNYSSGMQVRLAYSIAIQVPFDILLLDEVLAVGDAELPGEVLRHLRAHPRGREDDRLRQPRPRGRWRSSAAGSVARAGTCRGDRATRATWSSATPAGGGDDSALIAQPAHRTRQPARSRAARRRRSSRTTSSGRRRSRRGCRRVPL